MSTANESRRDFVKRATYVTPAVLSLAAAPEFAKAGSNKWGGGKDKDRGGGKDKDRGGGNRGKAKDRGGIELRAGRRNKDH